MPGLSALTAAALGIALSPLPFMLVVALLGTSWPVSSVVARPRQRVVYSHERVLFGPLSAFFHLRALLDSLT